MVATAIPTSALAFVGGPVTSEATTKVASEGRSGYLSKSAKGAELQNDYGTMKSYPAGSGRKSSWFSLKNDYIQLYINEQGEIVTLPATEDFWNSAYHMSTQKLTFEYDEPYYEPTYGYMGGTIWTLDASRAVEQYNTDAEKCGIPEDQRNAYLLNGDGPVLRFDVAAAYAPISDPSHPYSRYRVIHGFVYFKLVRVGDGVQNGTYQNPYTTPEDIQKLMQAGSGGGSSTVIIIEDETSESQEDLFSGDTQEDPIDPSVFENSPYYVRQDASDTSERQNWAVVMDVLFYDQEVPYPRIRANLEMTDFAKMGHEDQKDKVYVKTATTVLDDGVESRSSVLASDNRKVGPLDTNGEKSYITEVYTDAYLYANPFVLTSNFYYPGDRLTQNDRVKYKGVSYGNYGGGIWSGVEGFEMTDIFNQKDMGETIEYWPEFAHSNQQERTIDKLVIGRRFCAGNEQCSMWGFRDLYSKGYFQTEEGQQLKEESDGQRIFYDGKYLVIYEGEDGQTTATAFSTEAEKDAFIEKCGEDYITTFNGDFKWNKKENYFECAGNSCKLSPTVTATWENYGYFRVLQDGEATVEVNPKYTTLSSPAYVIYKPDTVLWPNSKLNFGGYEASGTSQGLVFETDWIGNGAASDTLKGLKAMAHGMIISENGDLSYLGMLSIENIFGSENGFELEKILYQPKRNANGEILKGDLEYAGFAAHGNLKPIGDDDDDDDDDSNSSSESSSGDTKLWNGLEALEVSADINTIGGERLYDFAAKIEAKDLFVFAGELGLKEVKGTLRLNNIAAKLGFKYEGAGFGITPATPFVKIKGLGGGAYNLAKFWEFDDPNSDPYVTFALDGDLEFVNLVDGAFRLAINVGDGQGGINVTGDDLNIKGAKIIDHMGVGVNLTKASYKYGNSLFGSSNFTGKRLDLGADMALKIMKDGSWKEVIVADAELNLGGFYGSGKVWGMDYNMISGGADATVRAQLKTPAGWKLIGGKKLAGVGLGVAFRLSTMWRDNAFTWSEAWNNAKGTFGAMAEASVVGVDFRVWYLSNSGTDWDYAGWFSSLKRWDWNDVLQARYLGVQTINNQKVVDAQLMYDENGRINGCRYLVMQTLKDKGVLRDQEVDSPETPASFAKSVEMEDFPTNEGESLLLSITPQEGVDMEAFRDSLIIAKNGTEPVTLVPFETLPKDMQGYTLNAETANIMLGNAEGKVTEDGEPVYDTVLFGITDEELKDGNVSNLLVASNLCDFEGEASVIPATTNLNCDMTEGVINASVGHRNLDRDYTLSVYLTDKPGVGQNTVEVIDEFVGTYEEAIPTSGESAPTGEYYVYVSLMEFQKTKDENGEDIEVPVVIDSWTSEETISYTNTFEPAVPENITLRANGNETMLATWNGVEDASGYVVKIQQQNADGTWQDTGCGYVYDATDMNSMQNFWYDADTNTYSASMLITTKYTNEEGEDAEVKGFDADQTYKVTVAAFKNAQIEYLDDNRETQISEFPTYGKCAESNEVFLPKYTPADISVAHWGTVLPQEEDTEFWLWQDGANGYGGANLTVQVTPKEGADYAVELVYTGESDTVQTVQATASFMEGEYDVILPEYSGVKLFDVKVYETRNGVTDTTTATIRAMKDETAPALVLDAEYYLSDGDTFQITGVTESDATVRVQGQDVQADGSGRFVYNGTLEEWETALKLDVNAMDEQYNASEVQSVTVLRHTPHVHDYSLQQTDSCFAVEGKEDGWYYYSCECGLPGEEMFYVEEHVEVVAQSLAVDSAKIGISLYLMVPEGEEEELDAYTLELDGKSMAVKDLTTTTIQDTVLYVAYAFVPAKEMTRELAYTLKKDEEVVDEGVVTVKQYANQILQDETGMYSDELKGFVKAMLRYGAAAQNYFSYRTDDLADAGIEGAEYADVTIPKAVFDKTGLGNCLTSKSAPISYYGMTLTFETNTTMTLIFKIKNKSTAMNWMKQHMTLDGMAVEPVVSGNYLKVMIQNIPPKQLENTFVFKVDDKAFDVSAIQYMYTVVTTKPGTTLCSLCKALYAYYLAGKQL
ncbi:MAG: hypothetical protein IJV50_05125 [Lachnospiraceae bacterium]|nr:hypothetical protein [Lachnospiraceae bacterium]